jgi:hypothetical protein
MEHEIAANECQALASPERKGPSCRASHLIKYNLPFSTKDDVSYILEFVKRDVCFSNAIATNPKIGNPFAAHKNHFFHQKEPLEKWKWDNTPKPVRAFIVNGLVNKGRLAIMQKERLHEMIGYIEKKEERSRVLKECNDELTFTWQMLDAFRSFDKRIEALRTQVDDAYVDDPNLNTPFHSVSLPPNE